ncbi:putative cytochrome P450 6a14 [Megachile rotundata]|uniref:putative cytochrome P450 6a14 n=1 Tax=Megachile rotundata TaxID=143995 RepID=UPI003FD64EFA
MVCIELLTSLVVVFLALYYYFTSTFNFWKTRDVPGPKPVPVLGNLKNIINGHSAIDDYITKLYYEYKNEPMIGIFVKRTPNLILTDLDLIKDVLIKDFSTFNDRGITLFPRAEPLSLNIFSLEAERWRPLRMRLSPIFTSGKLKDMFPLILECSNALEGCLEKIIKEEKLLDCREVAARFTTDVIGSCIFGISMNALADEGSEFRQLGKRMFEVGNKARLRGILREVAPWLYCTLALLLPSHKVTTFLTKMVSETIRYRKENSVVRPDFINVLMELKYNPHKLENIEVTDTLLTAQAAIFFAAGFETSSSTIGHALYEMALNPEVQKKLRKEIKEFYEKNKGNWTYENIKEMSYLDKVFKETLRKYPPVTVLKRRCNSNYTFSGTKVSIPKDTVVHIPVYAIHTDPDHYKNPEVFDPERFNEDAEASRHPMCLLPFGDGPRNCIGARFAVYQTKIGLIQMLKNYRVDVSDETMIPYEKHPFSHLLAPKRSLLLKISKVQS